MIRSAGGQTLDSPRGAWGKVDVMTKKARKGLTPKQQRFVDEYLVDLNATQAAIRAGYSEKTAKSQGQRLLTNVDVATAVSGAKDKRSDRLEITQDMVLREYWRIANSDLRQVAEWDAGSVKAKRSSELTDDAAAAISEISQTQHGTKIKLHNKTAALDAVAKHLGMFDGRGPDAGDTIINIDLVGVSDDDVPSDDDDDLCD